MIVEKEEEAEGMKEWLKHAGPGWELRRLIAHMDFAIADFCRVKGVKPFPVVASGKILNELISQTHELIYIYIEKH